MEDFAHFNKIPQKKSYLPTERCISELHHVNPTKISGIKPYKNPQVFGKKRIK
jgi:hypothetical protein